MQEAIVVNAIKDLLVANKETLEYELELDNMSKDMEQISASVLTPPSVFYYVAVDCMDAVSYYSPRQDMPNLTNISHATRVATTGMLVDEYNMAIIAVEYATKMMPPEGEVQSFEQEHDLFRTFTDRIVHLLDQTDKITSGTYSMWIPGEGGDEDRRISKNNRSEIWEDEHGQHFGIVSSITFTVRACSSSTLPTP